MPNFPPAVAVGLSKTPDYDSGWTGIPEAGSNTFTHNLGTKNLLPNIWLKRSNGKIILIFGGIWGDSMTCYFSDFPDLNSCVLYNQDTVNFVEARVQLWSLD